MKFKSLLLSTFLIAGAAIFSYCTKENPVAEITPATSTGAEAASRGTCKITVHADNNNMTVCGTQTTASQCDLVNGVPVLGSGFIASGGTSTYVLTTPSFLVINRAAPYPVAYATVTITGANGTITKYVPYGSPLILEVDDTCNIL